MLADMLVDETAAITLSIRNLSLELKSSMRQKPRRNAKERVLADFRFSARIAWQL